MPAITTLMKNPHGRSFLIAGHHLHEFCNRRINQKLIKERKRRSWIDKFYSLSIQVRMFTHRPENSLLDDTIRSILRGKECE